MYLKALLNEDFVSGTLEDYEDSASDSAGLQIPLIKWRLVYNVLQVFAF